MSPINFSNSWLERVGIELENSALLNIHTKILVALSGGVDSSVTLIALKELGFQVEALFMKNWNEDDGSADCTIAQDFEDAVRVCDHLGINLHLANFSQAYWDAVFQDFIHEHEAGRTPNPDILCNRHIKFDAFLTEARRLGHAWIATGHYARLRQTLNGPELSKGLDPLKDQSYFLHAVKRSAFESVIFPIGHLEKSEVRATAEHYKIPVHAKKDSTGICFIGERRFSKFIKRFVDTTPGPIVDELGNIIGEHKGLACYTIGQRQGLGIGGQANAVEAPWYVAEKDTQHNRLIVVQDPNHALLNSYALVGSHWNAMHELPKSGWQGHAKIRYRQVDQACSIERLDDQRFRIEFENPQRAITPGQYVVCYDGDLCLGGGVIENKL
ncbi:MAG: tRNA 2-thiouridine(34) synthase MnmA [Pseudomonadota bacterium]